jgi:hypothetical protein
MGVHEALWVAMLAADLGVEMGAVTTDSHGQQGGADQKPWMSNAVSILGSDIIAFVRRLLVGHCCPTMWQLQILMFTSSPSNW